MIAPGPNNDPTDIDGVLVGHHQRTDPGWGTGTTVVLPPPGTVGSVDVRGGGPATRETDALAPDTMVQTIDAVCFSGGSAYGLDAASGVVAGCEAGQRGFRVGPDPEQIVPIVGAAALFDLGVVGEFGNRPDASFGRAAFDAASAGPVPQGSVGAGTGATAGVLKGGIGTASTVLADGARVAALVAVNAAGSPVDPGTGRLWGAPHGLGDEFGDLRRPVEADLDVFRERVEAMRRQRASMLNTTLAVVVTDAVLTKPECARLAASGHDGMARALDPVHGYVDGDIVFGLATGAVPLGPEGAALRPEGARLMALGELLAAAANTVARAIVHATLGAAGTDRFPSYLDLFPSARP